MSVLFPAYNLSELFSAPGIIIVLVIALVLFGPNKLPELGKQIGSALRELNKAKSDMMRSFTLDHEPEPAPYNYNYTAEQTDYTNHSYPGYTPPPDLTDYTIAGQPPQPKALEGTVARDSAAETSAAPRLDLADYQMAPAHSPETLQASPAPAAEAAAVREGENHV